MRVTPSSGIRRKIFTASWGCRRAVAGDEGGDHVFVAVDEALQHVLEDEAAGLGGHGVDGEDGNDLAMDGSFVLEASDTEEEIKYWT